MVLMTRNYGIEPTPTTRYNHVQMGKDTGHRFGRRALVGLVIVLLVSSGSLAAWNYHLRTELKETEASTRQSRENNYPLLASRIFIDNPNDTILNFAPLRKDLRQYFSELNINYSFYAEYLPTGTSIKINADNPMVGASLLKVPVVMNLMYAAEQGSIDLSQKAAIQEGDIDKRSGTLWEKGVGYKLTLKELARHAIVDSDNTAINMLIGATSGKFDLFQKTIEELDVDLTAASSTETTLGAQAYSSMLKCLYLSCLNTFSNSQQILGWLTESNSPPRLRADLPATVKVAHKYGTSGGKAESDCGIVYVPKRPYIICIMIGADADEANEIIQEVSKKMYDYVTTVK